MNYKFGQYISAISNAACLQNKPFGYLIFGIDDETHSVIETNFKFKNRKEGNEKLELWVRWLLNPSVKFQYFPSIGYAKEKFKEKQLGKPFYHEIDKWEAPLFLNKAKITIDEKITNTALILLG